VYSLAEVKMLLLTELLYFPYFFGSLTKALSSA